MGFVGLRNKLRRAHRLIQIAMALRSLFTWFVNRSMFLNMPLAVMSLSSAIINPKPQIGVGWGVRV